MRKFLQIMMIGAAFSLSACAHDDRPDTRAQAFSVADTNKDMRLTYGEYKAYLAAQAGYGDAYAGTVLSDANPEKSQLKAFQQADRDNDTFVTQLELMTIE